MLPTIICRLDYCSIYRYHRPFRRALVAFVPARARLSLRKLKHNHSTTPTAGKDVPLVQQWPQDRTASHHVIRFNNEAAERTPHHTIPQNRLRAKIMKNTKYHQPPVEPTWYIRTKRQAPVGLLGGRRCGWGAESRTYPHLRCTSLSLLQRLQPTALYNTAADVALWCF